MHKLTKPLKCIKDIIYLSSIESTQTAAKELAGEGYPENTLIIAAKQTKGRGRFARKWDSKEGGLYLSLILKPKTNLQNLAQLNIKTAKAIVETLKKLYDIKARIKPPNDVVAYYPKRRKFLKISGVLTESSYFASRTPGWVVLGMGVNLNNQLSPKFTNAVAVSEILGRKVSQDDFLSSLFDIFWTYYSQWEIRANLQTK
jgi:BirA family biotin operon repressor/biotin-[acetyl-CoA-carboxylase] ligase